jgi:hypothetical protein
MEVFLVVRKSTDLTSAGVPWSDVPDFVLPHVEWIDNRRGPAQRALPPIGEVPVPTIFDSLPRLHDDRPRGSKAMLDVHGAKSRLENCRPGAWLISPFTGWKWAKWPDGEVGWVPANVCLPESLRVDAL